MTNIEKLQNRVTELQAREGLLIEAMRVLGEGPRGQKPDQTAYVVLKNDLHNMLLDTTMLRCSQQRKLAGALRDLGVDDENA